NTHSQLQFTGIRAHYFFFFFLLLFLSFLLSRFVFCCDGQASLPTWDNNARFQAGTSFTLSGSFTLLAMTNINKVCRSDPKASSNASWCAGHKLFRNRCSVKNKGLTGIEFVIGKGHWKLADEFIPMALTQGESSLFCHTIQLIQLSRIILATANSTSPTISRA
ncbi:hypothetical protein BJY52DRAFT_1317786, partial [Lactarius psammicola]